MNEQLIKKYRKYAKSEEAFAVLFVKKHISQAKGHWVDIVDCQSCNNSPDNLHFRYVTGGLYKRKIQPKYPLVADYTFEGKFDEMNYNLIVRAITWETAHKDIEQQKSKKIAPTIFNIKGVSYKKQHIPKDFFREDTPPEIKALAKNLNDRTDKLWDVAPKYANQTKIEYVYRIKNIFIQQ